MNEKFLKLVEDANKGDVASQLKLGELYEEGNGVKQDYLKAFEYYLEASKQGSNEATNYIGLFYQSGLGVEQNFKMAFEYFKRASDNGYKYANNNLGFLYLNGLGTERNFKEAYNRLKDTASTNKYLIGILEKINNGSKVVYLNNISEFNYDNLNDEDIIILNTTNGVKYTDYYTVKTIKQIKKVIDEIIYDIDLNDTDINKFIEVYIRLANFLSYDKEAYRVNEYTEYVEENASTSRNLIGLLTKKCVCEGYSDILLNILSCIGIESRKLTSYDHSFNKVKINNKWYYCDLTLDCKCIKNNKLEYCLLSKTDFEVDFSHIAFDDKDSENNSEVSYLIDELLDKELQRIK